MGTKINYKDLKFNILKSFNVLLSDTDSKTLVRIARSIDRCNEIECCGFSGSIDYRQLERYLTHKEIDKMREKNMFEAEKKYGKEKRRLENLSLKLGFKYYINRDPRGSAIGIYFGDKDKPEHGFISDFVGVS